MKRRKNSKNAGERKEVEKRGREIWKEKYGICLLLNKIKLIPYFPFQIDHNVQAKNWRQICDCKWCVF